MKLGKVTMAIGTGLWESGEGHGSWDRGHEGHGGEEGLRGHGGHGRNRRHTECSGAMPGISTSLIYSSRKFLHYWT